jgi:hypothetical protein
MALMTTVNNGQDPEYMAAINAFARSLLPATYPHRKLLNLYLRHLRERLKKYRADQASNQSGRSM